jgi:integrase
MSRKPFFRNSCWYVKDSSENAVRLCEGTPEERALWKKGKRNSDGVFPVTERVEKALARYTLTDPAEILERKGETTVAQLVGLFLETSTAKPKTIEGYRRCLDPFVKALGHRPIKDITPVLATNWLNKQKTLKSDETRYLYQTIIKMVFNFAVTAELLPFNKLRGRNWKFGPRVRREVLIYDEDYRIITDNSSPAFRDFFTALLETGRRPSEIANVKVSEVVELGGGLLCWRIGEHKNIRKTSKPEIIDLTPTMIAMTRRLKAESNDEFLFHSPRGRKWRIQIWGECIERLRRNHGLREGVVCYTSRHTFITKAMKNGVSSGDVANIVGNTPAVIESNYNHLSKQVVEARQRRIRLATAGDMRDFTPAKTA